MEQLVEGDVVILKRGDQVPADAIVLTSDSLELDESLLTGENDPIAKRPGDMVLSASSVLGGTGRVLLSHVGANSRASKISDEARQFSRIQSELRDALNRVVRWITVGLAVIIPVVSWGADSSCWWPGDRAAEPPVGAGFYCCGVLGCIDDSAGSGTDDHSGVCRSGCGAGS